MANSNKFSPEVLERTVRMMQEHLGEHPSLCAAIESRYSERWADAGIEPSIGSKGGSYDRALAGTIKGLYMFELIHYRAPCKTKGAVGFATLEWGRGSTMIACSNPSGSSRRLKLRQTTTGNSPNQTTVVVA